MQQLHAAKNARGGAQLNERHIDGRAKVDGGADPRIARDLTRSLDDAESAASDLGDAYIST